MLQKIITNENMSWDKSLEKNPEKFSVILNSHTI